jgi:hypothetical protein
MSKARIFLIFDRGVVRLSELLLLHKLPSTRRAFPRRDGPDECSPRCTFCCKVGCRVWGPGPASGCLPGSRSARSDPIPSLCTVSTPFLRFPGTPSGSSPPFGIASSELKQCLTLSSNNPILVNEEQYIIR